MTGTDSSQSLCHVLPSQTSPAGFRAAKTLAVTSSFFSQTHAEAKQLPQRSAAQRSTAIDAPAWCRSLAGRAWKGILQPLRKDGMTHEERSQKLSSGVSAMGCRARVDFVPGCHRRCGLGCLGVLAWSTSESHSTKTDQKWPPSRPSFFHACRVCMAGQVCGISWVSPCFTTQCARHSLSRKESDLLS